MSGSIGFFSFLGFIRMYTTISHPLDRSFFRIWKEAFETHWATSPVYFTWGPLIQVSLYFFFFKFQRRGWISASCSRHPHHLGGQCFCRVKLHRSWCRRTQTSGVFFGLYAAVMQLKKDCWKREARAPKGCFLEINWQCRLGNALAFCHIWRPLNRGIFIHLRQCDVLSMSHLNLGGGFIPVTWFISFVENKLRRLYVVPCA